MLTDFFIANRAEIKKIDVISDLDNFSNIKAKRVDPVKISTLEMILIGEAEDFIEPVKEFDSGDAWIIPIGQKLVEKLANLSSEDLSKSASDWSKTEEWKLDNGNETELTEFLKQFKQLAFLSQNEQKEMFVFVAI